LEPKKVEGHEQTKIFRRFAPDRCPPHFQIRSGATGHGIFFKEYYPQFNSLFVLHDVSVQHGGVVSRQVQFSHFTAYIMKVGVFSDIAARMTFLLSDHCIASIQWRHRFYCVIDMIY